MVGVAGSGDPAAVDFDPVASFTITIAVESPDGTGTFTLTPEDDAVDEDGRDADAVRLGGLAVISAEDRADGRRRDVDGHRADGGPGRRFRRAAARVTVTVTATLDAAARTSATEVVVGVAGSGEPAAVDFDPVASFTITIAAQAPDGTATFTLTPEDDAVDETDETLTLSGSADLPVTTTGGSR